MISNYQLILGIIFIIVGIPLWNWRYKFRSYVYKDTSWKINIRPWFVKETIALFSNRYFTTKEQIAFAWRYRIYLSLFLLLFILILRS